jgi:hypothetical protein
MGTSYGPYIHMRLYSWRRVTPWRLYICLQLVFWELVFCSSFNSLFLFLAHNINAHLLSKRKESIAFLLLVTCSLSPAAEDKDKRAAPLRFLCKCSDAFHVSCLFFIIIIYFFRFCNTFPLPKRKVSIAFLIYLFIFLFFVL